MWDCGLQLWDCHVSQRKCCPSHGFGRDGAEGNHSGARSPPSSLARVLGRGLEINFGRKCCPAVR
ncbi:unnamed protein product [Prunus armeniaca]